MIAAAHQVMAVQSAYLSQGKTLAHAALAGARTFVELEHYPSRDVRDHQAGTGFFYHAHRHDDPSEHGHFHLFAYPPDQPFFHLLALSIDHRGQALRWFTTNQWVTGGDWVDADRTIAALRTFHVQTYGRLAPIAQWLTAMVRLFLPDLIKLLHSRDQMLLELQDKHQDMRALLNDRGIDILSFASADVAQCIRYLIDHE
jgi:hypothetical protein